MAAAAEESTVSAAAALPMKWRAIQNNENRNVPYQIFVETFALDVLEKDETKSDNYYYYIASQILDPFQLLLDV